MRTMGIGQLSVLQPEIRRAGQCDFDTPERRNRMLCQPKSSREASHSATEVHRMRVEMLCEFRVGGMTGGWGKVCGKGASASGSLASVFDGLGPRGPGGALPLHYLLSNGTGEGVFWRRCGKWLGTCAANRAPTRSSGAGTPSKIPPAPRAGPTCAKNKVHLLQGARNVRL